MQICNIDVLCKLSAKSPGVRTASSDCPRTNVCITLPFVDSLSQKLRRVFQEFKIQVGFKPHRILRRILVHPKDPVPKGKKCDLVYRVECKDQDCHSTYIDETSQPLKERLAQHRRASTNSAVFDHQQVMGHTFNLEDVEILDREPRWFERGLKEAIFQWRDASNLNKKRGLRHVLSFSSNKGLKHVSDNWMLFNEHTDHCLINQPININNNNSFGLPVTC